jgi:hypothetical protein
MLVDIQISGDRIHTEGHTRRVAWCHFLHDCRHASRAVVEAMPMAIGDGAIIPERDVALANRVDHRL